MTRRAYEPPAARLTDEQLRDLAPPVELGQVPWHFTLTPGLMSSLLGVAQYSGQLSTLPLSYYRRKELAAKAKRERLVWAASGRHARVRMEDVDAVLRGARLDERREPAAESIRRAAIVEEALEVYTERANCPHLTPELAMAYQTAEGACPGRDLRRWFGYSTRERARMLDLHLEAVTVTPAVRRLFDWANSEPMVRTSMVLQAATYLWGMTNLFPRWHSVGIVLAHEFRVGMVDRYGLLSLTAATDAQRNLQWGPTLERSIADTGDFTTYFSNFATDLFYVMREHIEQLGRITSTAEDLPWALVAPPDELEARMFEVVERLGTAGSAAIVAALGNSNVPPMRTVQRRLQKMVRERTIVKNGARKTATYSVPGREVA